MSIDQRIAEMDATIATQTAAHDAALANYRAAVLRCNNHYASVPADDIATASAALETASQIAGPLEYLKADRARLAAERDNLAAAAN